MHIADKKQRRTRRFRRDAVLELHAECRSSLNLVLDRGHGLIVDDLVDLNNGQRAIRSGIVRIPHILYVNARLGQDLTNGTNNAGAVIVEEEERGANRLEVELVELVDT